MSDLYVLDLETLSWSVFASLPVPIGSHAATLVLNRYLVIYGGSNGMKFFDAIL